MKSNNFPNSPVGKVRIAERPRSCQTQSMGEVHQLILREGIESARSMAETRAERQAVEAAGIILAEEVSRLGITHAGFAMTSLPHKRIEDPLWRRQGPHT